MQKWMARNSSRTNREENGTNVSDNMVPGSCSATNITGTEECVWDLTGLQAGTHNVQFRFYDAVGNVRTKDVLLCAIRNTSCF